MKTVFVESDLVPFSGARALIHATLGPEARESLRLPLRPLFHTDAPESASLSDRQSVGEQIRFYTRHRCMRDFRLIGIELASSFPAGLTAEIRGPINDADRDFFRAVSGNWPMRVRYDLTFPNLVSVDHQDYSRASSALDNDGWQWLREQTGFYLNAGDSWTAVWLADAALNANTSVPPEVGDVLGLAYGLQDRPGDAEVLFRRWRDGGDENSARANYSLAMLYARHHPLALRSDAAADHFIQAAWETLQSLDGSTEQIVYERVFNRNGYALLLFRRREYTAAIEMLEEGIVDLHKTPFAGGVHHTVLLNNIGRVYAADGDAVNAEKNLRAATEIDPVFAEYWFDLASFLSDVGRFEEALEAANVAWNCSGSISDIPALIGFIHGKLGNDGQAADAYSVAAATNPDNIEAILGGAFHCSELSRYPEVVRQLKLLPGQGLSPDQAERRDLLLLEAESNIGSGMTPEAFRTRLANLTTAYPSSDLIRQNLEQLRAVR